MLLAFELVRGQLKTIVFARVPLLQRNALTKRLQARLRPASKAILDKLLAKTRQLTVARAELGLLVRQVRLGSGSYESLINLRVDFVLGQLVKHLQLFRLKELHGSRFDERLVLFQEPVEPVECVNAKFLGVRMRPLSDLQTEVLSGSIQFVNAPRLPVNVNNSFEREDAVFVRVGNQKRPRCDKGCDLSEVPTVRVDHEHAVAMPLDRPVDDVIVEAGDSGDRNSHLDPLIDRGDPPRIRSATGTTGDSETFTINFRSALQIVQSSHAVPGFDARRRVAARIPPETIMRISSVVDSFDLAQLKRVDRQTDVAVASEPGSVVLIVSLVTVADAVLFDSPMAADVKDCRQLFAAGLLRSIKIARDVEPRARLKMQILDNEFVMLDCARDLGLQRRLLRQRVEAQHLH